MARPSGARRGKVRPGKARIKMHSSDLGSAGRGKVRQRAARRGKAGLGKARVMQSSTSTRRGPAGRSMACPGLARQGKGYKKFTATSHN